MKRNIAYILAIMLLAASCISEQGLDVNSTRKNEVTFVAGMKSAVTRTLYGADNANSIKVKWVNGDQIKVFGTHCAVPTGEYEISEAANLPNVDGSQEESIADALVRLGDVGVQWGSDKTSDFVAVYPAANADFDYNEETGVVTASTTISATQNYVFNDAVVTKQDKNGNTIKVWEGTHFASDATNPSMQNAIMYARTDGVSAGSNVSLSFEPYSTVLKFRFEGFQSLWSSDAEAYVQSITITAPNGYDIAGDFDLTIPRNADVSASNPVKATSKENGTNTNSITINTIKAGGSYLKVKANEAVEFNVFTVPLSGLTMLETNPWTVTVNVQGIDPLVYRMLPSKNGGYTLVPGLIHKVKIPKMVSNKVPEWNPENWITQIPPPVYISELSVPGAWYCTNSAYQTHTELADLYNAGIRAFHIDCRVTKTAGSYSWFSKFNSTDSAYLAVAGTESSSTGLGAISLKQGVYVLDLVKEIVALAKQHTDEYVVIVLTIADQPKNDSDQTIMGSIAPSIVMPYIEAILNNTDQISYVVGDQTKTTSISASLYKDISANTTIEDVLGDRNVIIKVNSNTDQIASLTTVPNTLISFASMASDSDYNTSNDEITNLSEDYFTKMNKSPLYVGKKDVGLMYYYHQAQRTTSNGVNVSGVPTLQMRIDAIDDIIEESAEVYRNSLHNSWFQMGIGGFVKDRDGLGASENHASVSNALNSHLYDRIVEKMDTDPSPVGLVLMNHSTVESTVNGQTKIVGNDLVKAIIEMNGKFYLNRRGNDVITGGGEQNGADSGNETRSAAYVGPDAF